MDRDLTDMATEVFPAEPDQLALYPFAGQQHVLAGLQQDVAAGLHLLCITGPAGSGKTALLRALRQSFKQCLVGMIEKPTPGRLLVDVARALHLNAVDDDESILRRQLVMMLSLADKQDKPIIQIVDDVDSLSTEELNLLMHFFPSGHATLILAGSTAPETWLAGCATSSGAVSADRVYRLDPMTANETAEYIHYRLREAGLPDDLLQPTSIAAIHQECDGLPGCINRYCAEELAQTDMQGYDRAASPAPAPAFAPEPAPRPAAEPAPAFAPEPAPRPAAEPALGLALAVESARKIPRTRSDEDRSGGVMTAPVRTPARRKPPSVPSRPILPVVNEADAARRVRRLRRSARHWRAAAILASAALAVVLTRDVWIEHVPLDHAWLMSLVGQFTEPPGAARPPEADHPVASSSPVTPAGSGRPADADRSSDFAMYAPSLSPDSRDPEVLPRVTVAPPPAPAERPSPGSSAVHPDDGASSVPGGAGPAGRTPDSAPPSASPDATLAYTAPADPGPVEAAPAEAAPVEAAPVEAAPVEAAPVEAAPVEAAPAEAAPVEAAPETPQLTQAQRREVARLYAVRADYEWRNGDLESAFISIQRGLSSDPGNPELLGMRAQLRDAMRRR